jgi:hypothetical protein
MSSHDKINSPETRPVTAHGQDGQSGRRRFIKRAAGSAPLVMTLANRPVWGTGTECALSGILSNNVSDHHHDDCEGLGCTPGFWKENPKAWKKTGLKPGNCIEDEDGGGHHGGGYHRGGSEYYYVNGCRTKNGCKEYDDTGTGFQAVFGAGYGPNLTMMQVLQTMPGSLEFHACAAALNSIAFPSYFGYSLDYVVYVYQTVLDNGDPSRINALHDALDALNNRGCPIDAHGNYS